MFKIIKKIKYYDAVENQLKKITAINVRKTNELENLKKEIEKINKENLENLKTIEDLNNEIKFLKLAKGGYKGAITKLKTEVKDLTEKLVEARSGKYILKRMPSGRLPKGEPMKIRGSEKTSKIAKTLITDVAKEDVVK